MATLPRPALTSGVALLSAAAIAVPVAGFSTGAAGIASPTKLAIAQYDLTALTDITLGGITDALANGWGAFVGPDDPYYPGMFNNDIRVSGPLGAAYYVIDQAGIVPLNLDNYFFEVGARAGDAVVGGLSAVAYVGIASTFGINSLPGQLAKAVFGGGSFDIATAVAALVAGVPVIGPVASVFFTGQVPGDPTEYGTGFAGVLAYASTQLPGLSDLIDGLSGGDGSDGGNGNAGGNGNGNGNGNRDDDSDDDSDDDEADDDTEDDDDDEDDESDDESEDDDDRDDDDDEADDDDEDDDDQRPSVARSNAAVSAPKPAASVSVSEPAVALEVSARADAAVESVDGAAALGRTTAQRTGGGHADKASADTRSGSRGR